MRRSAGAQTRSASAQTTPAGELSAALVVARLASAPRVARLRSLARAVLEVRPARSHDRYAGGSSPPGECLAGVRRASVAAPAARLPARYVAWLESVVRAARRRC